VFIDGDMLLHPDSSPIIAHRAPRLLHAGRARARRRGADASSRLIAAGIPGFDRGLGGLRRLTTASPRCRGRARLANHVIAIKVCNQGFWRDDLVRVNGFNEAFVGWGPETRNCARGSSNAGSRGRRCCSAASPATCTIARIARRLPPISRVLEATRASAGAHRPRLDRISHLRRAFAKR
jgi:hypothetical protein